MDKMDNWVRILYVENGKLKKILKKVTGADGAMAEIDQIVVLEHTIIEFSYYHT